MSKAGKITRRAFLLGSAAIAGGTAFGYYHYVTPYANPLKSTPDATALTPYLLITKEGFTIITPRAEMGQGIHTTLAALVAEELDIPWDRLKAIHGPPAAVYYNSILLRGTLPFADYKNSTAKNLMQGGARITSKFLAMQGTGGSTSTVDLFERMRKAGAAARQVLLQTAAMKTRHPVSRLSTKNGFVLLPTDDKIAYQTLAEDAAHIPLPSSPKLKPRSRWRYLGKSLPRLDMEGKVTGKTLYATDLKMEGMYYATVRMNPRLGGRMISFDDAQALKMPGIQKIMDMGNGIGVIATSTWRAFNAAEAVNIKWGPSPYPATTEEIFTRIGKAFEGKASTVMLDRGNVDKEMAAPPSPSKNILKAEYKVPYLAHATMEPMGAVALFTGQELHLWAGTQAPTAVRQHAARVSGLPENKVTLNITFMGGGFGRRAEHDFTNQAVRLAMATPNHPVKLIWTREEDMRHDFYRPGVLARMKGMVSDAGPQALRADIAAPSVFKTQVKRATGHTPPGPDKILLEGIFDQPYAIPHTKISGYIADVAVPIGSWRSVGNSHNAFFSECFLDEMAVARNLDPVEMRLKLMKNEHPPSFEVLKAVAKMAGWNNEKVAGQGRGVAFTYSFGTPTAQIIDILQTDDGIKIDKVWCAVDVGQALDPRNIKAQIMSGIIFGLSAAVHGEITFEDGEVQEGNFDQFDCLRMNNTPEIKVKILENKPEMSGVGEPGTPPAMPALANAIFNLTNQRIRELPLRKFVKFA